MSKVAKNIRNTITAIPEEIGRQVTNNQGELRQTVSKIGEGALVIPRAVGETVSHVGEGALVIPRAIGKKFARTGSKRRPARTGSKKRPRRKGSGKRR